jgi:hypothetical protein
MHSYTASFIHGPSGSTKRTRYHQLTLPMCMKRVMIVGLLYTGLITIVEKGLFEMTRTSKRLDAALSE